MFYLDTNVIIDASKKKTSEQIKKHFKGIKPNKICIPAIVKNLPLEDLREDS